MSDAVTDEAGRFRIPDLLPADYGVSATHQFPGFGRRDAHLPGVRPGGAPVELRLTGGSTLVIRFHPEGRPDQELLVSGLGYEILADAEEAETGGFRGGGGGIGRSRGTPLVRIKLEPGTRRLKLTATGYAPAWVGPVEIVEDRDTAVDVQLTPE